MKESNKLIYLFEIVLLFTLLIILIFFNTINNYFLFLILVPFYFLFNYLIKKKPVFLVERKRVTISLVIFAVLYVALFYLSGVIINSFLRYPIVFSFKTIIDYIIPISLVIIISELIRKKLLAIDYTERIFNKEIKISSIFAFLIAVLVDLIIVGRAYTFTNLESVLMIFGFVFLSSISCNLLFNYIAKPYGVLGIILYRMITVLYPYFIPVVPDIYVFFKTFFRMIYPLFIYIFLKLMFTKNKVVISRGKIKSNLLGGAALLTVLVMAIMLISCQFKYGILVIGSESMTGSINIGDSVIFKQYNGENLKEGDVIVFNKNNIRVVHRIVAARVVNGDIVYNTKGDHNEEIDAYTTTPSEISGVVLTKIPYIGYPTLWLNSLFNKN